MNLKTYTGEKMGVLGQVTGRVTYQEVEKKLVMVVVEGAGPNLLGRGWLKDLGQLVNKVTTTSAVKLSDVLDRHTEVFKKS